MSNSAFSQNAPASSFADLTGVPDDNAALAAALAGKADKTCKVYAFIANQTGTDAPVMTVLQNDLGGTVVWARSVTGQYEGTLSGAFPVDKTMITVNGCLASQVANGVVTELSRTSDNLLTIITSDGGSPVDGQLFNTGFKVEVYL